MAKPTSSFLNLEAVPFPLRRIWCAVGGRLGRQEPCIQGLRSSWCARSSYQYSIPRTLLERTDRVTDRCSCHANVRLILPRREWLSRSPPWGDPV